MEGYMTEFSDRIVELRSKVTIERKLRDVKNKLNLLKSKVSDEEEPGKSKIVKSIDELLSVLNGMLANPINDDFDELTKVTIFIRHDMERLKNRLPSFGHHCSEFELILIRLDFLYMIDQELENILVELTYLFYKLKDLHEREMSEDDQKDFQKMSEIFIKYLPKLNDPCSEIDNILYKNGMLQVDEPEKINKSVSLILLGFIDVQKVFCAYYSSVIDKNTVNQCLDNAFLKTIVGRGGEKTWHYDKFIIELLESKIMYRICIGLKIFKTNLNADGFEDCIGQDLCYAVSNLSRIPKFVDEDENRMAGFVAEHAKKCHDLIKKKNESPKLPDYKASDIFTDVYYGKEIGQYEIRALYEIIKSGTRYPKILSGLLGCGNIVAVVHFFLLNIRCFYTKYEELDKEMREMDEHNGQEFGGFSLEANDDMKKKPLCADLCDVKKKKKKKKPRSTLNKYFFYDDAMKTLSVLSFLYNCVEKFYRNLNEDELKKFKVKSYVTQFVITLIHQRDLNKKIDKPIWIMEKILNTCHFIVFGHDEEKEKNMFLKLMNGEEIDEEELICLKDFMMKNELSYEDENRDYGYH